jgi:3-oxoacyl-[acyl-carrier-protein] synthase-3
MKKTYLNYISTYFPSEILDNSLINELHPEWSVDKISEKTGIHVRHIAAKDELSSDMARKVAIKLFESQNIAREDIDYLILCTQSPDYFLPTTACVLQYSLGLSKQCGAFDFNLGCSGFVYGMGLAKGLIATGQARKILLITAETYSKFIHPDDKSNKTIFGDAASAILLSDKKIGMAGEILDFEYGTDGSGAEGLIVKNGGMKYRQQHGEDVFSEDVFVRNDDYLFMDGKAVFEFTVREIPPMINRLLEKHTLNIDDVALYIFHQANRFMLNNIRRRCLIPEDKFFIHMAHCGNTVSSTIPIALEEAYRQGRIKGGDKVALAGFGVGLSWAGNIMQF